jgi:sugar PTS system EIIA component
VTTGQPASDQVVTLVLAPVAGRALPLAEVPDPVFASALVGPGAAIDPAFTGRTVAVSPVGGKIVKLYPHAFVVQVSGGAGVLVHLGIDTVQMDGAGFDLLVSQGADVAAGAGVVVWDPAGVAASGRSPVCPVIAFDADVTALSEVRESGDLAAGDPLFAWSR